MFCPKCGNAIVEGAAFCTKCGYQIPQPQNTQQAPQQNYSSWNNEPAPQSAPQQNYSSWNSAPAPQAAPQQSYANWNSQPAPQPYGQWNGGMNAGAACAPVKENYFSMGSKVVIIIFASLALIYGLISRIQWGVSFSNILFYALLPTMTLIATAILMNKVPPIVAIAPVGYELLMETIDLFKGLDYYSGGDYLFYFVYLSFTALFVFQLLTRKTVFKVFAVIIAFLVAFHVIGMWIGQLIDIFEYYDFLDIIEDMFDDLFSGDYNYFAGTLNYFNYIIYFNLAIILLVFGVKKKA